jgi:hypothetical protein
LEWWYRKVRWTRWLVNGAPSEDGNTTIQYSTSANGQGRHSKK